MARLVLLTDSFFANADGFKSQLIYVLLISDAAGACNIIHCLSTKGRKIARFVMAAEVQALVLGFYYAFLVIYLIKDLFGRNVDLETMIESRFAFKVVATNGKTAERRLQIYALALR